MKKLTDVLLLTSAFALFVLSGCVKENFKGNSSGTGIVFGASAGYAAPDTKTEYGDYDNPSNPTNQAINWVENDEVMVYSPQSPAGPRVDYSIKNANGNTAVLSAGENNLQWGTEPTQDFYAIYPSINSIQNNAVKQRVSFDGTLFKGYVPVNQQQEITYNSGTWTAKPNMDYLYMAAVSEDVQLPVSEEDNGLDLKFVPLTSTLEITFVGPMEHPMASFNVFADEGESIAGNFECDLAGGNTVCTATSQGYTSTYVTVSTYYNDNGTEKPLKLAEGESITFNVFLLPHDNLDNLSIRVAGFNSGSRTMELVKGDGSPIIVKPRTKTIVKTKAPANFGDINSWMTGLPDNVYISQLSIPGTANSFSYKYTGDNPDWYRTQTADIQTQWNAGIRCFELVCPENETDLANAPLQCNRTDVGISFGEAVDEIWNLVQANPGEFAMIIPAYESDSGHPGNHNGVDKFMTGLNNFYRNHTGYKYQTYGRNLTLGEARGSLMFVARITSEEDGDYTFGDNPVQGVVVYQWGSLKDLWKRRGYPVTDWAKSSDWESSMEYHMMNGGNLYNTYNTYSAFGDIPHEKYSGAAPSLLPSAGENDFDRISIRNDGSRGTAYVHYWPRVVKTSGFYPMFASQGNTWDVPSRYNRDYFVYWQESFNEKCEDVKDTFLKAIADNSGQQGTTFYINSLDGFYVDDNIPFSVLPYTDGIDFPEAADQVYASQGTDVLDDFSSTYYGSVPDRYGYGLGGTAGNIAAYATDINKYFYDYILDFGTDNIYGPMNVTLLDMVYSEADGNGPGSYLPSVIINNNYRFPLQTSGESGSTTSDASYSKGGAVWQ